MGTNVECCWGAPFSFRIVHVWSMALQTPSVLASCCQSRRLIPFQCLDFSRVNTCSTSALLRGMASRESANRTSSLKHCSPLLSWKLYTSTQICSTSVLFHCWKLMAWYCASKAPKSPLKIQHGDVSWGFPSFSNADPTTAPRWSMELISEWQAM